MEKIKSVNNENKPLFDLNCNGARQNYRRQQNNMSLGQLTLLIII
jgi:hypothetical protein